MSEQDDLSQRIALKIEQAIGEGGEKLDLSGEELDHIPPDVARLVNLKSFGLSHTQVTDLTPLKRLNALEHLDISGTQVSDLSPISGLTALRSLSIWATQVGDLKRLANLTNLEALDMAYLGIADLRPLSGIPSLRKINGKNAPLLDLRPLKRSLHAAANEGEGLALNQFEFNDLVEFDPTAASFDWSTAEGAQALFNYLDSLDDDAYDLELARWNLKRYGRTNEEQEEVFRVSVVDGKFDLLPALPTAAELSDPVKVSALDAIRSAVETLYRVGNRHEDIDSVSRRLQTELNKPFAEINLLQVHLDIETCHGIFARRGEREETDTLSATTLNALETVFTAGPGLTLDNPDVEKLEERRRRYLDGRKQEADLTLQDAISKAITKQSDLFGPLLRDSSAQFLNSPSDPTSRHRTAQDATNKNTVIAVALLVDDRLVSGPIGDVGSQTFGWLLEHFPIILAQAQYWGPSFVGWIAPIAQELQHLNVTTLRHRK